MDGENLEYYWAIFQGKNHVLASVRQRLTLALNHFLANKYFIVLHDALGKVKLILKYQHTS